MAYPEDIWSACTGSLLYLNAHSNGGEVAVNRSGGTMFGMKVQ